MLELTIRMKDMIGIHGNRVVRLLMGKDEYERQARRAYVDDWARDVCIRRCPVGRGIDPRGAASAV
jgi:hypothetical protein